MGVLMRNVIVLCLFCHKCKIITISNSKIFPKTHWARGNTCFTLPWGISMWFPSPSHNYILTTSTNPQYPTLHLWDLTINSCWWHTLLDPLASLTDSSAWDVVIVGNFMFSPSCSTPRLCQEIGLVTVTFFFELSFSYVPFAIPFYVFFLKLILDHSLSGPLYPKLSTCLRAPS